MPRYEIRGTREREDASVEFTAPVVAEDEEAAKEQFREDINSEDFEIQEVV